MFSWDWEKLNVTYKERLLYIKKQVFSISISKTSENVCFYFIIGLHEVCIDIQYFKCLIYYNIQYTTTFPNTKYLLELIKRRSKVQEEKNISCERALNLDQWKTFSGNYKPMRVWL